MKAFLKACRGWNWKAQKCASLTNLGCWTRQARELKALYSKKLEARKLSVRSGSTLYCRDWCERIRRRRRQQRRRQRRRRRCRSRTEIIARFLSRGDFCCIRHKREEKQKKMFFLERSRPKRKWSKGSFAEIKIHRQVLKYLHTKKNLRIEVYNLLK